MLPNWERLVIQLPDEFRRRYTGAAVRYVLAEPGDDATMRTVASAFVVAALDLYLLAHADLRLQRIPSDDEDVLAWGIRDAVFVLVWNHSDSAIGIASRIAGTTPMAMLISRSESESRLARKLADTLGDSCSSVVSIDSFISTRVLFSSAQLGWSRERTTVELFRRYNDRLREFASFEGTSSAMRQDVLRFVIATSSPPTPPSSITPA